MKQHIKKFLSLSLVIISFYLLFTGFKLIILPLTMIAPTFLKILISLEGLALLVFATYYYYITIKELRKNK